MILRATYRSKTDTDATPRIEHYETDDYPAAYEQATSGVREGEILLHVRRVESVDAP